MITKVRKTPPAEVKASARSCREATCLVLSLITFSSFDIFLPDSLAYASTLDSDVLDIAVFVAINTAARISMTIATRIKLVGLFNYLTFSIKSITCFSSFFMIFLGLSF